MEVVKEPLAQWEFDILKQLAIEKPNNVGLTGGQFLEILSRLEKAEQDTYSFREGYEVLKGALVEQGERLEQAEQAVQRVREVHRPVSDPFGVSCAVCIGDSRRNPYPCDTIRALDGDGRG